MDEQRWKNLDEEMKVSDRWSYNPTTKELILFWWRSIDDEGTLYKAKGWFLEISWLDFLKILRKYRQSYRATWFRSEWQIENACCLKED